MIGERNIRKSQRCCIANGAVTQESVAVQLCQQGKDQEHFLKRAIDSYFGVGVFATADFLPGAFLLQYSGELVDEAEAEQREEKYKNMGNGCYMYYFEYNREIKCTDATESTGLGKFVNDCIPAHANSKMRMIMVNGRPSLCLFACVEGIMAGTEIRACKDGWSKVSSKKTMDIRRIVCRPNVF